MLGKLLGLIHKNKYHKGNYIDVLCEDASVFKYFNDELKKDYEVCMLAIEHDPANFKYIDGSLKQSMHFIAEASKFFKDDIFKYISNDLTADKDFMVQVIKNADVSTYDCLPNSLKNDVEICKMYIDKEVFAYNGFIKSMKYNIDVVEYALKKDSYIISYLNEDLRSNKKIAMRAILANVENVKYLSDLMDDAQFCFDVVNKINYGVATVYNAVSSDIRLDEQFTEICLSKDIGCYDSMPYDLKSNQSIIKKAFMKNTELFKHLSDELKIQRNIYEYVLSHNPGMIVFMPKKFYKNILIVAEVVSKFPKVFDFLPYDLQNNSEIKIQAKLVKNE